MSQVDTTINAAGNLVLQQVASVNPVQLGDTTRLDLKVTNSGPGAASNVSLTSTLPVGLTYVTSLVTDLNFNPLPFSCTYDGGTRVFSCPLGSLANGGNLIVQLQVSAALRGTFMSTARVASPNDPNSHDSTASLQITAQPISCGPRGGGNNPRVTLQVSRPDPNRMDVTVTTGTTNAPNNRLERLQFGTATNAVIDVPGGVIGGAGNFGHVFGNGPQSSTFTVRRMGVGAMTVPFQVIDYCTDPWPTFVGAGS